MLRFRVDSKFIIGATLTITAAAACRSAASVVFDLPEKPPQQATAPAAVRPSGGMAAINYPAQDTTRPPIEGTLNPDSALALLPKDGYGRVDWVAAVHEGAVNPRRSLPNSPAPPEIAGFKFDFVYPGPAPTFDAVFPHSSHVLWLKCENCHPTIFRYRNTPPTMTAINQGEACGACHGKVSFPATGCVRCHPAMGTARPVDPPVRFIGDLVLARGSDSTRMGTAFPRAVFPHWVHRVRYACSTCHQELFGLKAGSDTLNMADMRQGRTCGRCHDGTNAFDLIDCNRCHVPAPEAPAGSGP